MVQHVPASMQQPSNTYEIVGSQTSESAVSDHDRESEFPDAETPVQICCARTRDRDGIEVLPVRLCEQRTQRNIDKREDNRPE